MIKIEKHNVSSRVLSFDTKAEEDLFREVLKFKVPNYFWMTRYRRGGWDGYHSFYNRKTQSFPTGMLSLMPEEIQERLIIDDKRVEPQPIKELDDLGNINIEFRDYQWETVSKACSLERCSIESPTGSGKTELAIGITWALAVRTLFCVHLSNLLWQAKERFEKRLGIEVGVISAKEWNPKAITIAMIPTIYARLKNKDERTINFLHNEVDCLFLDECHHLAASSWETPAKACRAYFRFGLSATAMMRDDIANARLIGQTGEVITAVSKQELIERGLIAKPLIKMLTNRTMDSDFEGRWQTAYRVCVEENSKRNKLVAKIAKHKMLNEDKQVLIIVHTVKHARELLGCFRGVRAIKLITGAVSGFERQTLIKRLDKKRIMGIIATPVFDEGADIPNLRVLIIAGGGKSPIKIIQRMGRGMRKKEEGDNVVEIFDFLDAQNKFTHKHSMLRKKVYQNEGFDTSFEGWN